MAYIEPGLAQHEENTNYFLNGGPEVPISTGTGALAGGPSMTADQPNTAYPSNTPSQTPQAQGSLPAGSLPVSTGSAQSSIFDPLAAQTQGVSQRLEDIGAQFRAAAGPQRTWEGIGGESTLQQAISPQTPEAQRPDLYKQAQDLVNARYTGPTGLDPNQAAGLSLDLERLGGLHAALGSGGGVASMLKQSHPGLTPGMARWEAKRLTPTESFRTQKQDVGNQIQRTEDTWKGLKGDTNEYAKQRAASEGNIAQQAQNFLTNTAQTIQENLQGQMDAAREQTQGVINRLGEIKGGAEVKPGELAPYDNPWEQKMSDAQAKLAEIMAKYPDIQDQGSLGKGIAGVPGGSPYSFYTPPGSDVGVGYPSDWAQVRENALRAFTPKQSLQELSGQPYDVVDQLIARQKELEGAFQPDSGIKYDELTGRLVPNLEAKGEYSDVAPMYYGEPYAPTDKNDYVRAEGSDPATMNASQFVNEDQVYTLNQVSSLLGQAQRMAKSDPWQAAQLVLDMQAYLGQENQRLEELGDKADKGAMAYATGTRKAQNDITKLLNSNRELKSVVNVLAQPSGAML